MPTTSHTITQPPRITAPNITPTAADAPEARLGRALTAGDEGGVLVVTNGEDVDPGTLLEAGAWPG